MSKTTKNLLKIVTVIVLVGIVMVGLFWNWHTNEPMRVAKKDVAGLKKSIDLLKELKVEIYWNRSGDKVDSGCLEIKYYRGWFIEGNARCFSLDPGVRQEFDDRTRADFKLIQESVEIAQITSIQKESFGYIFFKDHPNSFFYSGKPEGYYYFSGYGYDKYNFLISVDGHWYYNPYNPLNSL